MHVGCVAPTAVHSVPVVANTPRCEFSPVANADVVVANRHGKYADPEKRKKYMRELMAARRLAAREKKEVVRG